MKIVAIIPTVGRPTLTAAVASCLANGVLPAIFPDGMIAFNQIADLGILGSEVTVPDYKERRSPFGHRLRHAGCLAYGSDADLLLFLDDDNMLQSPLPRAILDGEVAGPTLFQVVLPPSRGRQLVPGSKPPAAGNMDGLGLAIPGFVAYNCPWPNGEEYPLDWGYYQKLLADRWAVPVIHEIIGYLRPHEV